MSIENAEPKLEIIDVYFDNEIPYMDGQILEEGQFCIIIKAQPNISEFKDIEKYIDEFI